MATLRIYNISGINLAVQPLLHKEGDLLRSINVESFPIGAKRKRPGYITYLGTANGSQVDGLFNWTRNNGTQFWNYRFSGGLLYSSQQGTGAWTITGNGTFSAAGTITNAVIEDYRIFPNRRGFFGYGGAKPELLSNAIGRQVYNDAGSGIIGTTFDSLPAATHQYRYYASIGTITDDLTNETINDAIAVYDFQQNDWWNYKFANRPTAWLSYKDTSGNEQFIFGGGSQCYQIAGTATSDNGTPIETVIEGVVHATTPDLDKEWREITASFNPGAQAKIQVAFADTFTRAFKTWIDIGDTKDGIVNYHFPQGSRSKLLFWKVYDNSATARYNFYGLTIDYDLVQRR